MTQPKVFGILNVTPDSFYDAKGVIDVDLLEASAIFFLNSSNIYGIDVGAESTRPGATPISPEEEIKRLSKILPFLLSFQNKSTSQSEPSLNSNAVATNAKNSNFFSSFTGSLKNNHNIQKVVSLDTRNYQTAKFGIELGVSYINDVSGLQDPKIADLIASNPHVKIIVMHSLTVPSDRSIIMKENANEMLLKIKNEALQKILFLERCGIKTDRIVFDPGLGFGKNQDQSLHIIKNIDYFLNIGTKVLVGHSRKSFIKQLLPPQSQSVQSLDIATHVLTKLFLQKVDYIRLHKSEDEA